MSTSPSPLAKAITFLLASGAFLPLAVAQSSYTYNPLTAGTEAWSTSAKWGLGSGYPSGEGIIAEIQRTSTARTLSLAGVAPTVGKLAIGQGGTGSGQWTLSGGSLTLNNGANAAEINVTGATATLSTTLTAANGTDFTGTSATLVTNASSRLNGGITVKGSGSLYLYHAAIAGNSTVTLQNGTLRLGSATATMTFANDIAVTSGLRGIYSNTTTKLTLESNITGLGGVLFGTESASRNDVTELKGDNRYEGATEVRTHLLFHSLSNFGDGAITFANVGRTLTYAEGNTADLTKTVDDTARLVTLSSETTVNVGGNHVTFANSVAGAAGLIKSGSGTLTLSGSNSFTNATVTEGVLAAGHASALGGSSSNLTLQNGAGLSLLADAAVEIANLSLTGDVRFDFRLGTAFDSTALLVNGNQVGAGIYEVGIHLGDLVAPGTYTLLSITGGAEATGFVLDAASAGLGTLFWENNTLTFQAIPEPSGLALLFLGAGALGWRFRQKRRPLLKKAVVGVVAASALLPHAQAHSKAPEERPSRDAKAERFLGPSFRVGVYVYLYTWDQWKDASATDLHDAINQIADIGFTSIYFGGVSDKEPERWEAVLDLCLKRKLAVVAQLDFAYLQLDSDIESLSRRAVPFIRKYKDHPAVLAFSVKEEPGNLDWVPKLQAYYTAILKEVPDAPLHLLESVLPVMKAQLAPYPEYTGTDRYAFWWEFSPSNNRATPRSALAWYRSQADAFYQVAAKRGQNFEMVFTDWIQQTTYPLDRLREAIYPKSLSDKDRDAVVERYLRLAREKKQGLALSENGEQVLVWKYYRPPANCMSAMAWLGVMEGADSLSVYTWNKPKREITWHKTRGTGSIRSGLLDWDERGTASLAEYAAFAREIRPYGRLIRSLQKETTPLVREPEGHEVAETEPPVNPLLEINERDTFWRSFRVPGFNGKVAIVVNTEVGSWSDGRSPTLLSDNDPFRINDRGELIDYISYTLPRRFSARVLREKEECVDLMTGTPIPLGDGGSLPLSILPGKGRLLYIGPNAVKEYPKLVQRFACHPSGVTP